MGIGSKKQVQIQPIAAILRLDPDVKLAFFAIKSLILSKLLVTKFQSCYHSCDDEIFFSCRPLSNIWTNFVIHQQKKLDFPSHNRLIRLNECTGKDNFSISIKFIAFSN